MLRGTEAPVMAPVNIDFLPVLLHSVLIHIVIAITITIISIVIVVVMIVMIITLLYYWLFQPGCNLFISHGPHGWQRVWGRSPGRTQHGKEDDHVLPWVVPRARCQPLHHCRLSLMAHT